MTSLFLEAVALVTQQQRNVGLFDRVEQLAADASAAPLVVGLAVGFRFAGGAVLVALGELRGDELVKDFGGFVERNRVGGFGPGVERIAAPKPTLTKGAPAVAYGEEILMVGGSPGGGAETLTSIESYDTLSDSWRHLTDLPDQSQLPAVAIHDGVLYVIGGVNTQLLTTYNRPEGSILIQRHGCLKLTKPCHTQYLRRMDRHAPSLMGKSSLEAVW